MNTPVPPRLGIPAPHLDPDTPPAERARAWLLLAEGQHIAGMWSIAASASRIGHAWAAAAIAGNTRPAEVTAPAEPGPELLPLLTPRSAGCPGTCPPGRTTP